MTLAALPGRLVLAVAVLWSTATVSLTAAPVCRILRELPAVARARLPTHALYRVR